MIVSSGIQGTTDPLASRWPFGVDRVDLPVEQNGTRLLHNVYVSLVISLELHILENSSVWSMTGGRAHIDFTSLGDILTHHLSI